MTTTIPGILLLCATVVVVLHERRPLVSLVYCSLRRAGHAEGSGSVRVCAQNRSPEMPNDIPLFAPAGPEGPVDPERPEDSKGPERQQGPDGTNLLKVPDVPMQAQPQSQPQPQPEPQPQRHAQPPTTTRESCNTDLAARSNSVISINSSSDLSMERPTEPRLLLLVPEANDTTTVSSTVSSTVDSVAVATDAEAVSLAPAAPGLLAATNPTQNSPVRVSDSTALVSATSCEGISSTESGGVSTACGGVSSRSKPLPEETIPTPMQMPMQMMQMPMQMNMQMPSVEAEPPPPTVPISADMKRGSCEVRNGSYYQMLLLLHVSYHLSRRAPSHGLCGLFSTCLSGTHVQLPDTFNAAWNEASRPDGRGKDPMGVFGVIGITKILSQH